MGVAEFELRLSSLSGWGRPMGVPSVAASLESYAHLAGGFAWLRPQRPLRAERDAFLGVLAGTGD